MMPKPPPRLTIAIAGGRSGIPRKSFGRGQHLDYDYNHRCRWGKEKVLGGDQEHSNTFNVRVLRQDFPLLGAYVPPRTLTERKLAQIFCNALRMDKVSINDDFEELGGDSLVAVSICAEIEKAFAIEVPIAFLVRSPTVGQLAPRVDELVEKRKA